MQIPTNQPCPHCGRFANRGSSVDAIITNENNQILLIKRGAEPYKGYLALIGGYIEWDESAEDAVKREVMEETSLQVTEITLVGVYTKPDRHPKQVINIAFVVKTKGMPKAGDDATAFQWIDLNNLPENLAFDHRQIINDYIKLTKH